MTIAHVVYGMPIGGIETMLVNIANRQSSLGHEIHIVVINAIIDESLVAKFNPQVTVHRLNRRRGSRNPLPVLMMNFKLWKIRPDVIHLHFASISKYILLPSLKRKLCVTLHALCNEENIKNIDKSGSIFAISETVRENLKNTLGLESTTVTNGIDISQVRRKEIFDSHTTPFKIVQVGRLNTALKGQDILIRAAAQLVAAGRDINLTFIGDGESRVQLENLVAKLGLSSQTNFLGSHPQEYVLSHLADYDLFVQPSRFEGFGLTVAEAMAAGVPVLVSDNNGPVEVIGNGRYGYIFKNGDSNDCARLISEIMDNYPSPEFLETAVQKVKSFYNVTRTASEYISLYNKVIISKETHH